MPLKVKFILKHSYDFVDGQGRRIAGAYLQCFDPVAEEIIKVKIVNATKINGLHFGDDLTIQAIPHGRYLNYEV